MWIGLIHMIFPKARIIHCRRNPIDTCLSIYSTYFTARMDFSADRGDLVFFYRQYERLMAHWQQVLPPEVYYETQYEELVADREARSASWSRSAASIGTTRAWCRSRTSVRCAPPASGRRASRSTRRRWNAGGATSPGWASCASWCRGRRTSNEEGRGAAARRASRGIGQHVTLPL